MEKFVFILVALMLLVGAGEVEASGFDLTCDGPLAGVLNKCVNQEEIEPNREEFDYGAYLHLILWEGFDGNVEVGSWNTWEINRGEVTSLLGVKVYLNRLTYQK